MTENKYIQLKKRAGWLGVLLAYLDGRAVSDSSFNASVKLAKHFQADFASKIARYEVSHGIN